LSICERHQISLRATEPSHNGIAGTRWANTLRAIQASFGTSLEPLNAVEASGPQGIKKMLSQSKYLDGGRTRTRTLDPLIKSHMESERLLHSFRQTPVPTLLGPLKEFSVVGMTTEAHSDASLPRWRSLGKSEFAYIFGS
jgi:hypothetical protein